METQFVACLVSIDPYFFCKMLLHRLLESSGHVTRHVNQGLLAAILEHFFLVQRIRNLVATIRKLCTDPQILSTENSGSLAVVPRNGLISVTNFPLQTQASLVHDNIATGLKGSEYLELPKSV